MVEFVQDLDKAWDTMGEWGYSWSRDEYEDHFMVDVSGKGFLWYEWIDRRTTAVHMACNPSFKRRFLSRHMLEGMMWAAELMGVKRIYSLSDSDEINRYLVRLNWSKDEIGYFINV